LGGPQGRTPLVSSSSSHNLGGGTGLQVLLGLDPQALQKGGDGRDVGSRSGGSSSSGGGFNREIERMFTERVVSEDHSELTSRRAHNEARQKKKGPILRAYNRCVGFRSPSSSLRPITDLYRCCAPFFTPYFRLTCFFSPPLSPFFSVTPS